MICSGMADLGVRNQTFFTKVSELMNQKHNHLKAIDCAQIMTAYCKLEMYDRELFYMLENNFYSRMKQDRVNSTTLITMFLAHQNWSQYMADSKSQHPQRFSDFKDYSIVFQNQLLTAIQS